MSASADNNEVAGLAALWKRGQHLRAGADYLAALQKLGLNPECLFWADDEVVGHPVLVLVTRQFDRVGPLALSSLLFKAYDAAATPREINPFVLRLHSPEQSIIRELSKFAHGNFGMTLHFSDGTSKDNSGPNFGSQLVMGGGLRFQHDWIYKWEIPQEAPSRMAMTRQWRRFAENVDRLVA